MKKIILLIFLFLGLCLQQSNAQNKISLEKFKRDVCGKKWKAHIVKASTTIDTLKDDDPKGGSMKLLIDNTAILDDNNDDSTSTKATWSYSPESNLLDIYMTKEDQHLQLFIESVTNKELTVQSREGKRELPITIIFIN